MKHAFFISESRTPKSGLRFLDKTLVGNCKNVVKQVDLGNNLVWEIVIFLVKELL